MLSTLEVLKICGDFVRPIVEGEEVAKTLQFAAGIKKREGSIVVCEGLCLATSGVQSKTPHVITVKIDKSLEIGNPVIEATCSCLAGQSSKCKHVMALIINVTKKEEEDLDDLSSTDTEQQWGHLCTSTRKEYEAQQIEKLCHVRKQRDVYDTAIQPVSSDMRKKWIKKFQNSMSVYQDRLQDVSQSSTHNMAENKPIRKYIAFFRK